MESCSRPNFWLGASSSTQMNEVAHPLNVSISTSENRTTVDTGDTDGLSLCVGQ